jgi:hypothetical protein
MVERFCNAWQPLESTRLYASRRGMPMELMQQLGREGPKSFHTPYTPNYPDFYWRHEERAWGGFEFGAFSFPLTPADSPSTTRAWKVVVPYWALAVPTAVMPARSVWRWWRRRRKTAQSGRCPACGYDLRATPERCPECGRG